MENEKTEILKNLAQKRCLKIFVHVRKLPADAVQKKSTSYIFRELYVGHPQNVISFRNFGYIKFDQNTAIIVLSDRP